MFKISENKNTLKLDNTNVKGMKFQNNQVKPKDIGNISLDLSKEEAIMRSTPGLIENSMIENITTMNSIFQQKQTERLMLNNLNNINVIQNNEVNNSNQTLNNLVDSNSGENYGENPLDMAVIIKDSKEVMDEERKRKKGKKNPKKIKKKELIK